MKNINLDKILIFSIISLFLIGDFLQLNSNSFDPTRILDILVFITAVISIYIAFQANKKTDQQFISSQKSRDIDLIFKLLEKNMVSEICNYIFSDKMLEDHLNFRKKNLVKSHYHENGFFINDYYIDKVRKIVYYNSKNYLLHSEYNNIYNIIDDFRLINSMIEYKAYKSKVELFLETSKSKDDENNQLLSKKQLSYSGLKEINWQDCDDENINKLYHEYYENKKVPYLLQTKIILSYAEIDDIEQLEKSIKKSYNNINLYTDILKCYRISKMDNWLGEK